MIDFDPVAHAYKVDGRAVPSVTQVLSDVLGDPTNGWGDQFHLDRGSAAHTLYAMLARGEDLRLYDYDQRLAGHVKAWQAWRDAEKPEFIAVEKPVAHEVMGYAGTFDALCIIDGQLTIINYKQTSGPRDLLQMAAYAMAIEHMRDNSSDDARIKALCSVQITADGWRYGPQARGYRIIAALFDWRAVFRVWQIKQGGVK